MLLIGCTNVASLLVSHTVARQREIAVRSAIGAGRMRIVVQFMTETLLLCTLGVLAGTVLAAVFARLFIVA